MSHLLSVHSGFVTADEPVDPSAAVHESAVVEPPSLVGPGCEIGAGAVVRAGSCLRENVRVGPNATVEGSIIDADASVGANAMLRDTILGPGVHVGSGTVSPGGSATLVVNGCQYTDRRLGGVVADHARIGGNVTLVPGARIGPFATVAHGATVEGDVDEQAEVIA
jgi:glucose-1-phosphate thymidylyltransferase